MLFDPTRHEPLQGGPWNAEAAREGIAAIVAAAVDSFHPETLWPTHPRDVEPGEPALPMASLYQGAAGVVWALHRLRDTAGMNVGIDLAACAAGLMVHQQRYNEAAALEPHSFLLSNPGIALLDWKLNGDSAAAESLYESVEANLRNPTQEFLWGSPGTLTAAIHVIEATGDARWIDLLRRGVDILWDQMHPLEGHPGAWAWTQDLYRQKRQYAGAGHGFVGNIFPVARGARWLDGDKVSRFIERVERSLPVCMQIEGDLVNWEPVLDPVRAGLPSRMMVQDCHGAPGFICRLAGLGSPTLNEWLVSAGELVWRAGPLAKGPGLCHGTAGNGQALLRLHAMTGDERWLARARAFAMHALAQSEQEAREHDQRWFSLWTGDLGVALFADACLRVDAAFPTLDVF